MVHSIKESFAELVILCTALVEMASLHGRMEYEQLC